MFKARSTASAPHPSPPRTIAIGDIHGCSVALDTIRAAIVPEPEDTIVIMGDFIDRGIDTKGVIERLIELSSGCRLITIQRENRESSFFKG